MSRRASSARSAPPADRPSAWAIALLLASGAFALLSMALLATGYGLT
ncbi:MAG: hypothetical protein JNK30_21275 [Phenylobacterium sp.]|nr:hypothetical protein [Phenylobacterium sp.]MBL8773931.1 hypothetical protein [Phenylobacterium sp.]